MTARLQAYRPLNTAIYGGVDIKVTWKKENRNYGILEKVLRIIC